MDFVCFVWISEITANLALQNIKRLVFITEVESVYSTVRTESLYNTDTFVFKRLIYSECGPYVLNRVCRKRAETFVKCCHCFYGEVFCSSYSVYFFILPYTITCWMVSVTDKLMTVMFSFTRDPLITVQLSCLFS
jgi:hypothetical protein